MDECGSAPQLEACGAKVCAAEPGDLGFNPCPTCFDLDEHCIGVCHCCVMHVKDLGLAFILHWKNFSSTRKTQGAHLGRPTSRCLSIRMTLFENKVKLE